MLPTQDHSLTTAPIQNKIHKVDSAHSLNSSNSSFKRKRGGNGLRRNRTIHHGQSSLTDRFSFTHSKRVSRNDSMIDDQTRPSCTSVITTCQTNMSLAENEFSSALFSKWVGLNENVIIPSLSIYKNFLNGVVSSNNDSSFGDGFLNEHVERIDETGQVERGESMLNGNEVVSLMNDIWLQGNESIFRKFRSVSDNDQSRGIKMTEFTNCTYGNIDNYEMVQLPKGEFLLKIIKPQDSVPVNQENEIVFNEWFCKMLKDVTQLNMKDTIKIEHVEMPKLQFGESYNSNKLSIHFDVGLETKTILDECRDNRFIADRPFAFVFASSNTILLIGKINNLNTLN